MARTPSHPTEFIQLMLAKAGPELGLVTVLGDSRISALLSQYDRNFSYFDSLGRLDQPLTGSFHFLEKETECNTTTNQ